MLFCFPSPPKICSKQMQKITEADDMYLENTEEPVCWQILKKDKRLVSIAWDGGEKQSLT